MAVPSIVADQHGPAAPAAPLDGHFRSAVSGMRRILRDCWLPRREQFRKVFHPAWQRVKRKPEGFCRVLSCRP